MASPSCGGLWCWLNRGVGKYAFVSEVFILSFTIKETSVLKYIEKNCAFMRH
jgi:hypothetical protein